MDYPIGEYYCKLDAKGRLLLPSSFKEQLGDALNEGFVLRPGLFEKCLDVYGKDDWRKLQEKLGKLNPFKKENLMMMRRINGGARVVMMDGSGRLQIPKDLVEKCAMVKEVVITSLPDRMQIWAKEQMDASNAQMTDEEFSELLEDRLGNIDFE
ncbi:MAG: division/cell wall cluster transcriptional repressor MraZ [Bacteroidales bacterium]|nr:division/cell wall cluster transcriptional repressor MraZ [Bacteroidales bacterium]